MAIGQHPALVRRAQIEGQGQQQIAAGRLARFQRRRQCCEQEGAFPHPADGRTGSALGDRGGGRPQGDGAGGQTHGAIGWRRRSWRAARGKPMQRLPQPDQPMGFEQRHQGRGQPSAGGQSGRQAGLVAIAGVPPRLGPMRQIQDRQGFKHGQGCAGIAGNMVPGHRHRLAADHDPETVLAGTVL